MRVIITAGPTREHLDPVRFLSNPSTGKMGFAIAAEAARRGHDVTLIAGPVSLKTPKGVKRIDVVSAREMLAAVLASRSIRASGSRSSSGASDARTSRTIPTVFISTAAVADWRPARCATKKLKKGQMSASLKLVRNPDILKTLARWKKEKSKCKVEVEERTDSVSDKRSGDRFPTAGQPNKKRDFHSSTSTHDFDSLFFVGFAAETNDVLKEAARKCREKGLSFIVANDVTQRGCGFGTDTNKVTFVFPDGTMKKFPLMTKRMVSKRILDEVSHL